MKKLPWRCKNPKQAKDKAAIYNSREWQELRAAKIRSTLGLCEVCKAKGYITPANIVHHIHPIEDSHSKEEMRKWAFMRENLLTVCQSCHTRIHKEMGSGTARMVNARSAARQDRWADNLMSKFVKQEENEGIQHQQTDIVPPQGER